ncbi:Fucoxanthin-chlorophyll a-c binding protein F, chloroplastic [Symbiodinium microadriaticum]|uniref:Fucoxanthin-chlorophyll a-c binding protein F, chloroplastic n=1 Tax=Symbiodinium microadriaticum TaxID=2951 RepID=A0A1Q9CHS1_SYMMI|nr:Fucoxanthin-chlorophyll a-c binding protein F, chloroplastic [Symbiodinium microadriaticum]
MVSGDMANVAREVSLCTARLRAKKTFMIMEFKAHVASPLTAYLPTLQLFFAKQGGEKGMRLAGALARKDTRVFKQLSKQAAETLGAELGPNVQLRYPLPTESPEQWCAAAEGRPPQAAATTWWAFITALLVGTRFVLPNKLRRRESGEGDQLTVIKATEEEALGLLAAARAVEREDLRAALKRQIQSEVGELRDRVEAQGNEIAMLRRREIFAEEESTRESKSLANHTAMAIFRELARDWKRTPGHFVVRLELGEASLRVQQRLQSALGLGQWIGKAVNAAREKGEASFNLYLDKTPGITGKFPGYLSPSAGLKFADVPNGLAAISKVPAAGWGQILAYMAFCEVSQDQSPGTPAAAGDFGFKVLTSSDPAEKTKKLSAELANGRLAMMAIIGMFFQDGLTGSAWGDWANYTASPLRAFENELGAQAPVGFFDPFGLTKDGDVEAFKRRRATELKNGRVALLATMGYIVPEYFRFPGYCSPSAGLKFTDIPNGLAALSKVPGAGWTQIFLFLGLVEKGLYTYDPTREPGNYANAGVLGVPNGSTMAEGEGRNRKLNSELANGRLAMMAIIGMFFQDGLTGSAWGDWAAYTDSPLRAFENELGVQAPVGYFDPLGMSKDGDEKTFRRRRESELKNGRVAMFAAMGCPVLNNFSSMYGQSPKKALIRQEAALAFGLPSPLLYDAFRGPSECAKRNRGEIQRRFLLELAQPFPEFVNNVPSSSSSAPLATVTPGMNIFTDGSCEVSVRRLGRRKPAGWGVAICHESSSEWQDYFGPVILEKKHPDFLGATLGSNNTAVAGLRSLQWRRVYGHTGVTTKEPIATRTGELEAHKWAKVRLVRRPAQLSSTSSTPAVADGTPGPTAKMSWSEFSSVLINAVDATAGRSQRKKLASFYTDADRDEIQRLMMQHTQVWQKLKLSRGLPREAALRHELHSIKDSIRRYKQASRDRWVLDVVHTLEQAVAIHDIKQFYNTLPKFGIHAAEGHSKEGKEPFTPQEALDHLDAVMNHALPVQDALADLRESAPGLDEITVLMLRLSGELGIQIITPFCCPSFLCLACFTLPFACYLLRFPALFLFFLSPFITPEYFRFPGFLSPTKGLKFADVPNGLAALSKVPFLGWIQILVFCGMVDFGLYRADPSRDPGDYENAGILGVPNASGPMADAEGRKRKLNSELANGRLAMMAITGMLFQNGITGTTGPAMWGF